MLISIHTTRRYTESMRWRVLIILCLDRSCSTLSRALSPCTMRSIADRQPSNPFEAIRLEACRSILSKFPGSSGDLLRMAANAVRENQATTAQSLPSPSKRIFLSDLPLENRSQSHQTIADMFQFLLEPSAAARQDFWTEKLTLSEAIKIGIAASVLNSSLAPATKVSKKKGHRRQLPAVVSKFRLSKGRVEPVISRQETKPYTPPSETYLQAHITKGRLSEEKRVALLRELRKDPLLAPLLNLAKAILEEPQPHNSSSPSLAKTLSRFQNRDAMQIDRSEG
jgi:hypothetical protein